MKKLLIGFLASFMALACFAGCGDNSKDNSSSADNTNSSVSGSEETSDDLATAKDYLKEFYREKDVATRANYTLLNEMMGCSIAWSVDVTEGVELVVGAENTQVKLTAGSEDIAYVLTATLTDANGNTATVSFNRTVLALEDGVISAPAENTVYYMSLYQGNTKKTLYLTGEMNDSGKFFGMTSDGSQAAAVYAEAVEDGYKFYVLADDNSKSYLTLTEYQKSNGYYGASVSYTADGTVLHYEDLGCWAATLEHDTYFLGTYGTYETASASTSYYMTEDKMGTEQFPLQLVADTVNDNPSTETPDDNSSSEDATNSGVSTPDDDSSSTTPDSSVSTPEDGNSSSTAPDDGGSTETPSLTTPEEIVNAAYELGLGETLGEYTLTGVITAIGEAYNTQFKNTTVTIVVGDMTDKPIVCFRMKSGAADATALKIGDTITVSGTLMNYCKEGETTGTVEFNSGCVLDAVVAGDGGSTEAPDDGGDETTETITTIPAALEAEVGTEAIITGTVVKITYAYSADHDNISVDIADENGVTINVFRMKGNVTVGQIIKVTGSIGTFNSKNQIAEGSTFEVVGTHTCSSYTEATCKGPATCVVCDTAKEGSTAVNHNYVNGVCKWCSSPEGVETQTVTVSIATYADTNTWENSVQYTSIVMNEAITVTAGGTPTGNYGVNTGKYYTSGENWRIYQNEDPSVTITAAEGKTIISVKITYSIKNTGTLTLNGNNVASDEVVTVNGSSITFSVGNTGTATNGQAQITAIEVVYA